MRHNRHTRQSPWYLIMLSELSVQNMALIEDVRVELQPGFCAWTGETGAGKTLLLSALGLLLGERGAADLLRAGAEELRVVGRFELVKPGARRRTGPAGPRPRDAGARPGDPGLCDLGRESSLRRGRLALRDARQAAA